jgi:hypothetical protein
MARYPSKIDAWLGALIGISVLVPVTVLVMLSQERVAPLLYLPVIAALVLVLTTFRTYYDIKDDELLVRSGLFRWRIAISSIRRLRASGSLLSAPALSMDRIEVQHDGGAIAISPRDRAGFIRALRARVPRLALDDLDANGVDTSPRSHPKGWVLALIPLSVLTTVALVSSLPLTAPQVTVTPTSLVIEGAQRESFALADIHSASIEDSLPPLRKSFGMNTGRTLRGRFTHPQLGEGRVWVRRNEPPYILARTREGFLLLNLNDPESTRAVYAELSKRLEQR